MPPGPGEVDPRAALPVSYVDDLVVQARKKRLGWAKQWLRMGHWKPGLIADFKSEADGDKFFLSPRGKTEPDAELEATIRGFFAPGDGNDHPICRFPMRFLWLGKQLAWDSSLFATVRCPRLERWFESLAPASATVVFSSYFLSTPASAFGHTLLRINKHTVAGEGPRRELLDTGINYSATVDTGNVLLYAFKGLFGLFPGHFSRMPYYYKVREYNDFESRDLWEYQLSLSPEALTYLVAHIWELGQTYFDYYYLSENCSYHILAALEAAEPSLDLLEHVKYPVIPGDTIKALKKNRGLIKSVAFRPSVRSQFMARLDELDGDQRDLVIRLADDPKAPLPTSMPRPIQAKIMDAAVDLLDLRHTEDIVMERASEPARMRQALLARRANLVVPSEELEVHGDVRGMPDQAHGSRRVALGGGASVDGEPFAEVGFRVALHDLADSPLGYPEFSEIEFLPTTLRFWGERRELQLESSSFVRITHLMPITRFHQKISWAADAGAIRLRDAGCDDCLAGRVVIGGGLSTELGNGRLTMFALLDTAVEGAPSMIGPMGAFRIGGGPAGGIRLRLSDDLVAIARGALHYYPWQDSGAVWSANGSLRWRLFGPFALDLGGMGTVDHAEARASVMAYY